MSETQAISLSHRERGRGEGPSLKIALPPEMVANARRLRAEGTDAESLLWFFLRDRRFKGLKFRRQQPMLPYVLDFYCQPLKLAVEVDGGQHNETLAMKRDEKRTAFLFARGIEVIRYWNDEVLKETETVLEDLWHRAALRASPSSGAARHLLPMGEGKLSPSPAGRGAGVRERGRKAQEIGT